ncbi:hypothetical protein ACFV3R_13690 [Streptomyces sp. NPDC059740]|uniref:hypothetical protein n=1 Tax=Streptomyces sp. NPDC059740 TaxID=3346926 RepID=UPI0036541626
MADSKQAAQADQDQTTATLADARAGKRAARRVARLTKEIQAFAAAHGGGARGQLAHIGLGRVRIALVAADGTWGTLLAESGEIAEQAAERAGLTLQENFDGEMAAQVRTGPYEWSRMAGIQLGGRPNPPLPAEPVAEPAPEAETVPDPETSEVTGRQKPGGAPTTPKAPAKPVAKPATPEAPAKSAEAEPAKAESAAKAAEAEPAAKPAAPEAEPAAPEAETKPEPEQKPEPEPEPEGGAGSASGAEAGTEARTRAPEETPASAADQDSRPAGKPGTAGAKNAGAKNDEAADAE